MPFGQKNTFDWVSEHIQSEPLSHLDSLQNATPQYNAAERAYLIELMGPDDIEIGTPVKFQFNPVNLKIDSVAVLPEANPFRLGLRRLSYGPTVLTFDLVYDTTEAGVDVQLRIAELLLLLQPACSSANQSANTKSARPPRVGFRWAAFKLAKKLNGVLTSSAVNFTSFRWDGTPLRAELAIKLHVGQPEDKPEVLPKPTNRNPRGSGGQLGRAQNNKQPGYRKNLPTQNKVTSPRATDTGCGPWRP